MTPLLCFLVILVSLKWWSSSVHAAAQSISVNGLPSVIYLTTALDDVRLIERRAALARPATLPADRSATGALKDEFDRVVAAERETPEYPGEYEGHQVMRQRSHAFFDAVDDLLADEDGGRAPSAEVVARVSRTADALAAATSALIDANKRGAEEAARRIEALHRSSTLHDVLTVICLVAGTLLGFGGARHYLQAAEKLRRLDGERLGELDTFAGRVAHDLRNPLQAIQMRCWVGERAPTAEGARDALTHVVQQTRRMNGIIDALLVFARAAAHPDPRSRSEVAAVVAEIVNEAQPPATAAQIELVVEPVRATTVACDPSVLAVVLSNLVRNAIKYIGGGSHGVRRITLRERFQGRWLRFEVEDTGPGLPPGAEAEVFDPFVRLAAACSADGIGLGLATVKRLVEANQGQVGVDSQQGHGCCFWFTLPLAA